MGIIRRLHVVAIMAASIVGCASVADSEADTPAGPDGQADQVAENIRQRFPAFFPDGVDHSVPLGDIFHGGPPKDGIPTLTRPRTIPASKADYLEDGDVALGLERNGRFGPTRSKS